MDIMMILQLVGGLALFLYGMNIMSDGLEKFSGSKLKSILESLTSSPLKSVLLGAAVTAVIQSSSATTVMVVGFVNSGIMTLTQSVGIIMGANIGTTITAWIFSLLGLEGESLIMQLLKPTAFSAIFALIGIILVMFVKNSRKQTIGTILLGFAVLMFGMDMMSSAVTPLGSNQQFQRLLTMFSNTPLLGVLAGAIFTAIIQSSSASVGVLQAISLTGTLSYASAIPIIMGQNIGTCITAILSSIGANKNAKRVGAVHLSFNLIGTIIFLIVFYALKSTIGFGFIGIDVNNPISIHHIAIIHTLFNVCTTVILFPFGKLLVHLANFVIKNTNDPGEEEAIMLDERFFTTPAFAIDRCKDLTVEMAELSRSSMLSAISLVDGYDVKKADHIAEIESKIDMYEDKLGTYLVHLGSQGLLPEESIEVSKLLHCIGDFERIADHAVNISDTAKEIHDKKITFTDDAKKELSVLTSAVKEIMAICLDAFAENNVELAKEVEPLEQVIDYLKHKLKKHHVSRLQTNDCTIEVGFVFSDLLNNYERIADHCSNVAVAMIQLNDDSFDTHEYLNELKRDGEQLYNEKFEFFSQKYALPHKA